MGHVLLTNTRNCPGSRNYGYYNAEVDGIQAVKEIRKINAGLQGYNVLSHGTTSMVIESIQEEQEIL
jgi:hypothetical protein